MEVPRQPRAGSRNIVAVPLTSIYSQNWPIPRPDVMATHNSSSSCDRSLNDGWTRSPSPKKQNKAESTKTMENRIKSAPAARCSSRGNSPTKSLLFDSENDEIEDTVKEFKLTMQLFKRLTRQVREVNEYMNNQRTYSFKHHLNNEGIASPALRRSQLAAALSKREIPATQAQYEPITDLGPPTVSSRSTSRLERDPQTSSSATRPASSIPFRPNSSPGHIYTRQQPIAKMSASDKAKKKDKEKKCREADDLAKKEWIQDDQEFEELFVPEKIEPEDMQFRFHDPYPKTWVDETVEDACFRGKRKVDPFMHRLDELEDLQEETVLWEKLKDEKTKQTFTNLQTKKQLVKNVKKGNGVRSNSAKYPYCKTSLSRPKSTGNKIKRTVSAGRSSTTSNAGSEDSDITTFRNSGYDMGVSFKLGSMYPETRPKLREKKGDQGEKVKTVTPISPPVHLIPKSPHCEACHYRKTASKKYRNCKSAIPTLRTMRTQYKVLATESYDIVDLAQTFDPPCKHNMDISKSLNLLSTEERAVKKGIVPSKSAHSQRRISLTSEGMAIRGINPILNFPTPPQTRRSKSAKVSVKQKSSKQKKLLT